MSLKKDDIIPWLVCVAVLVLYVLLLPTPEKQAVAVTDQPFHVAFELTDHNGKKVTDADFKKYRLVYFGFTSCPEICPLGLKKIEKAVEKIGKKADKLDILFITTDPERDTPKVMKDYLSGFKPAPITGLTGTAEQIKQAQKGYGVFAQKRNDPAMTEYTMDHSATIYFLGPGDMLLDFFGSEATAADIEKKLSEKIL
jgi:protein SCO1